MATNLILENGTGPWEQLNKVCESLEIWCLLLETIL